MFEIIDLEELKGTPIAVEGVNKKDITSAVQNHFQSHHARENRPVSFSLKQLTHKLSNLGYEKDFVD